MDTTATTHDRRRTFSPDQLREAMRRAQVDSVKSLAMRTGITRSAIYYILNNTYRPSAETLNKFASALSVTLDFFYTDSPALDTTCEKKTHLGGDR